MKILIIIFLFYNLNLISSQNLNKKCCPLDYRVTKTGCVNKFGNVTDEWYLSCDSRWMKSYSINNIDKIKSDLDNGDLEYCVDLEKVYTCPCIGKDCVNVCCDQGQTLNFDAVKCEPSTPDWVNWNIADSLEDPETSNTLTSFHKMLECDPIYIVTEPMKINETGVLLVYSEDGTIEDYSVDPEYYCISTINLEGQTNVSAIFCLHSEEGEAQTEHNIIYSTLLLIGAFFLLATLLVYAVLPELRRAVQGLSLMAHCACMLVAHLATVIVKLEGHDMEDTSCYVTAYVIQFSFLSGFFWMNVICVDIASKFRSLQSMVPRTSHEIRKFGLYAIYAMGCPFLMFILTIILNNKNEELDPYIRPNIGHEKCWFEDDATKSIAILLYFYLPIGFLILFNTVLFIFTALKIFNFTRDTQTVTRSGNNDKTSFVLFVKLFILMGLPWLTEIISWAVGGDEYYWYFTDALNILRSVFIFILFCCKSRVWDLLKGKCSSRSVVQSFSIRTRSEHSSSSHVTNSITVEMQHAEEFDKMTGENGNYINGRTRCSVKQ